MVFGNVYIVFHVTEFLAIINEKYSSVYGLSVIKQVTFSAEISSRSEVRNVRVFFFFRKFYRCSKFILVSIMLYIHILVFLGLCILWDMCIL